MAFKESRLQQHYALCRKMGTDPTSEFFYEGRPRRGAGHRDAYWKGYEGHRPIAYPRNTFAYAAWAAGRDNRRAEEGG